MTGVFIVPNDNESFTCDTCKINPGEYHINIDYTKNKKKKKKNKVNKTPVSENHKASKKKKIHVLGSKDYTNNKEEAYEKS